MPSKGNSVWKLVWIVMALALLAGLFAPEVAAEGHRVVAEMDEPFEINGRIFPHGKLAVRSIASYNPTTTLNELWVGGHCLGLLLAVESTDVGSGTDDTLIFERSAQGHLLLVGYAYRGEAANELYQFRTVSDGGRWFAPPHRSGVMVASK